MNNDKKWNDRNEGKSLNHSGHGEESPKVVRKRFGSEVGEELIQPRAHVNGDDGGGHATTHLSPELENLKQEILRELRRDLNKVKLDIIEGE